MADMGRVISGSAALCPSLFGGYVPCGYIDRPLADGDVRWVFPALEDTGNVLALLHAADRQIRMLASHDARTGHE